MYNDNYNCKAAEECCAVPVPAEPMKSIIIGLNGILGECRSMANAIEEQLFGPRVVEPCKDEKMLSMYDALTALRRTAKETLEILCAISQKIEG